MSSFLCVYDLAWDSQSNKIKVALVEAAGVEPASENIPLKFLRT